MIQVIVEKDKRDDGYEREQHVKSFILWSKERAKNLIIEKDPLHSKSILNSSYAIKFEYIGELGDKKEVTFRADHIVRLCKNIIRMKDGNSTKTLAVSAHDDEGEGCRLFDLTALSDKMYAEEADLYQRIKNGLYS